MGKKDEYMMINHRLICEWTGKQMAGWLAGWVGGWVEEGWGRG